MNSKLAIILLFTIFLSSLSPTTINSSPDQVLYEWRGIYIPNNSRFSVGPYELEARTTEEGSFTLKVWLGFEVVAMISKAIGEQRQILYTSVVEDGQQVFKVGLFVNRSSPERLYVEIFECVYSPPGGLEIEISPSGTLEFEEGAQELMVNVTVINTGSTTSPQSRLTCNLAQTEGNGTYNLLYVTGIPSNPQNITVSPLPKGGNTTFEYHFYFNPGTNKFGEFVVNFALTYAMKFKYNETESTASLKVYDYYPEGIRVTETANLIVKTGEKFKLAGNPDLRITLAKNASLVYPKGSVEFRFSVRNEGNGTAYGVKIWIRVDPPSEIQFLAPSQLGRVLSGALTEPITLVQQFPNGTVVEYPLPPNGYTQDVVFIVKVPDYPIMGTAMYRVTISVEWDDLAGRHFNTTAQESFSVIEPGKTEVIVTKEVVPLVVPVNGTLSVTITVRNDGEEVARDIKVTDTFPEQFFEIVSGTTTFSRSILRAGETVTFSYILKAKMEGRAPIDRAIVEYIDETGAPRHTQSNPGGVVSIVMPDVEYEIKEKPEPYEIVGSYVSYRVSIRNKGTGVARNIEVIVQLPDTLMIVEAGEGCDIEETSNVVKFRVSELPPNEEKELFLELRPLVTGKYNITVTQAIYYSPDGGTKYSFSIPEVEFRAMKPIAIRIMLTVVLAATVIIVAVLVIAVTVGIRIGKPRPTMRRLGRRGFRRR